MEFPFSIAEKVLDRLASHAYHEICLVWGVNVELHKLKETLSTIKNVLLDAEEKQTMNPRLTEWLGKLKDVCYDIDDVLNEFEVQELQMQVPNRGNIKGKVCSLFSRSNSIVFRFKMGHRIKVIRERLGKIAAEKSQFDLIERAGDWHGMYTERETYSVDVHVPNAIGRDKDKEQIIAHLLQDTGDDESVSVISIMGLGGLGKTTLAKLVYHDNMIRSTFGLGMWVRVSDDFNNKRLVRDIIAIATNQKCGNHESMQQMQIELKKALRGVKFLLVLDDVWDKQPMGVTLRKWNSLNSLLKAGANGSKIIVTTRNESVASLMRSAYMHELQGLPHSDCMSIFINIAFRNGEEQNYPNLMKIGEVIVKKCGGVPLAVATLGGLFYLEREEHYWLHVRDDDIWKLEPDTHGILPALKLSYNALPPYLKLCFSFCSLLPKDYKFMSTNLISCWMAQGFLEPSKGNQAEFEEIGLDYIGQLCSRSLFQIVDETYFIFQTTFKMHDLVHDLAIQVSQVECSFPKSRPSPSNTCRKVRHMSISQQDLSRKLEEEDQILLHLDKLRTILITDIDGSFYSHDIEEDESISHYIWKTCISRFKYLRVLDLQFLRTISVLPSSIGNLSHLRYLNLKGNKHIEKLPESICKLQHLQTLLLEGCEKLEELPKDIGNLVSLRFLSLTINHTCFPKSFARLTSLRTLIVEDCQNLISFGEGMESSLTNLGRLDLTSCENLESLPCMNYCSALETLNIINCRKLDLMGSGEGIGGLVSFFIADPNLDALPDWLQESANSLQCLYVIGCDHLTLLPEWLQNLRLLKLVYLFCCSRLLALPEGMHRLAALRELWIEGCPQLSERCKRLEGEDWSNISHVTKIMLDGQNIASTHD